MALYTHFDRQFGKLHVPRTSTARRVDTAAVDASNQLERWVTRGVSYARSLPVMR